VSAARAAGEPPEAVQTVLPDRTLQIAEWASHSVAVVLMVYATRVASPGGCWRTGSGCSARTTPTLCAPATTSLTGTRCSITVAAIDVRQARPHPRPNHRMRNLPSQPHQTSEYGEACLPAAAPNQPVVSPP
jgi:hypothetical protein